MGILILLVLLCVLFGAGVVFKAIFASIGIVIAIFVLLALLCVAVFGVGYWLTR